MIEYHTHIMEHTRRGYVLIIYCKQTERYHSINNKGELVGENCLDNILNRDDLIYIEKYDAAIEIQKALKILDGNFIKDFHG